MTERMSQVIGSHFPLSEIDCEEYSIQKIKGMKFSIRAFYANGFGHVSFMTATGFFGLMKMDTLIINPMERDMPLLSYDRIFAMSSDTLIFELCDTFISPVNLSELDKLKADLPLKEHQLGKHWYDSLKLFESVSVKGKRKNSIELDTFALNYLDTYLCLSETAASCNPEYKTDKARVYVEGLLKNGGPSTDLFIKAIGRRKTAMLFRKYLFGTQRPL